MEDFPTRIADFLESLTARIRGKTVEPVARAITWITLGLVAIFLVGTAFTFLLVGIFRIVGELVRKACDCTYNMEITYAAVGGLFLLLGALLWRSRTKEPPATIEEDSE